MTLPQKKKRRKKINTQFSRLWPTKSSFPAISDDIEETGQNHKEKNTHNHPLPDWKIVFHASYERAIPSHCKYTAEKDRTENEHVEDTIFSVVKIVSIG